MSLTSASFEYGLWKYKISAFEYAINVGIHFIKLTRFTVVELGWRPAIRDWGQLEGPDCASCSSGEKYLGWLPSFMDAQEAAKWGEPAYLWHQVISWFRELYNNSSVWANLLCPFEVGYNYQPQKSQISKAFQISADLSCTQCSPLHNLTFS